MNRISWVKALILRGFGGENSLMVFFVCEGCNESLKKNQVDKHAAKCRSCHAVTCVDCSVTFYGNDYAAHMVCVSEAEKYEKSLFKPKVSTKVNPQDTWIALIEEAATRSTEAPSHIRQYILRLNDLGNVPRNRGKFVNFVKNSIKIFNTSTIEEIWNFLEKLKAEKDSEKAVLQAAAAAVKEAELETVVETEEVKALSTDAEKEAKKARKAERKRLREIAAEEAADDKIIIVEEPVAEKSKKKKTR